jgi:uncharacterized membrane protein
MATIESQSRGDFMTCEVIAANTGSPDTAANTWTEAITMARALLIVTLLGFGALTAVALAHHGYIGIFTLPFQTWGGTQVLADLVIALTLVMVWMWQDARATGRNVWPWVVATLALGSFGPLLYLLTRKPAAARA